MLISPFHDVMLPLQDKQGIGVTEVARYSVKRVDADYFVEE